MSDKILIDGGFFTVASRHKKKGDATVRATVAKKTGLFKEVRVAKSRGEHVVAVRGSARDPTNISAESLRKETGLPETIKYNRRTGRII
jgi:hypothetical protein